MQDFGWNITHLHEDHLGAFVEIMKNPGDISVNRIYTIDINYDIYSEVAQPGDRIDVYDESLDLRLDNITYLYEGDNIDLIGLDMQIFSAFWDSYKEDGVGGNLMNESSLVFKLSNKDESILFCSDIMFIHMKQRLIRFICIDINEGM